ncbi:MAG: LolA-related protein [Steroidobacter sp.]
MKKAFDPVSFHRTSVYGTGLPAFLKAFFIMLLIIPATQAMDVEQLMEQLAQSTYSTAHFTEHKYLHSLSKPLELNGILKYTAPDHFVKQTLQPKMETMTIDGDTLTVERSGRARTLQLQDYPVMQAFVECIRGTMRGNLKALRQYYDLDLSGDQQHWQMTLLPKDASLRKVVDTILISGSTSHIDTIEIRETRGDRSVMNIARDEQ